MTFSPPRIWTEKSQYDIWFEKSGRFLFVPARNFWTPETHDKIHYFKPNASSCGFSFRIDSSKCSTRRRAVVVRYQRILKHQQLWNPQLPGVQHETRLFLMMFPLLVKTHWRNWRRFQSSGLPLGAFSGKTSGFTAGLWKCPHKYCEDKLIRCAASVRT